MFDILQFIDLTCNQVIFWCQLILAAYDSYKLPNLQT